MPRRSDLDPTLKKFARNLRKESTDAEQLLWSLLRGEKIAGFKLRRQHPVGGFIVDFVCRKANLVVELDGGQHGDASAVAYDTERTRRLEQAGFRVLRVADHEMLKDSDAVMRTIYRELIGKDPSP
jgi:very-short-patch-repair endonuclease